jgi:hypothetical protein
MLRGAAAHGTQFRADLDAHAGGRRDRRVEDLTAY